MAYPTSPAETFADGAVHLIGLALAIPCSALLLIKAQVSPAVWTATALYVSTLLFALAASAIYHLLPYERCRAALGRIDHASIYFKIAGTYTPVAILIGGTFAYAILGLVWALAVGGAVAKLWFWRTDARGSLALYLGMGWLSVLLIWPMWRTLPAAAIALIIGGGAIYSLGTIVYAHPGIKYQNAIWHVFVLVASGNLFAAIAVSVQAASS